MSAALVQALALSAAVGSGAYTVTSAKISRPVRELAARKLVRARQTKSASEGRWQWTVDLLGCPYCTAHWLAFVAVAAYRPWVVDSGVPVVGRALDFVATSLVLVVLAMGTVWLIKRALAPVHPPLPEPQPPTGSEVANARSVQRFEERRWAERLADSVNRGTLVSEPSGQEVSGASYARQPGGVVPGTPDQPAETQVFPPVRFGHVEGDPNTTNEDLAQTQRIDRIT